MNHREKVAREQVVISICVGLSLASRFQRESYARKHNRRPSLDRVANLERIAITEIGCELAERFAPFALFDGEQPHHWQISQPAVQETLQQIPMDQRAALASRTGRDVASEIAMKIFLAVDGLFRLVPLPGHPGPSGHSTWAYIYAQEYGSSAGPIDR